MLPKIVPDRLVIEEVSFQTITEGVYKKLIGPKRKGWPKFPLNLGSLIIPSSNWVALLSDHIVSLKLGFSSKRKNDPKGFLDAHFKKNHVKGGYTHEKVPDDSIYQGVYTFFEVLARAKSKEEQSHILQYKRELKIRIQSYRAMEMDLLEKVRKGREEQEAQETKVLLVVTDTEGNKGKDPMQDLPEVTISQQLKVLMHTSQQSKQKLTQITSALDNQATAIAKPIPDIQVTTTVTSVGER